ncbi:hypothetical protein [Acidiplasma aeolicum]|jgi:hypothetical protein|uniref:hypothetical protein n=1 Tax=Acidiplasma aeolicum TaxID=507754 RepID=UPI00371A26F3
MVDKPDDKTEKIIPVSDTGDLESNMSGIFKKIFGSKLVNAVKGAHYKFRILLGAKRDVRATPENPSGKSDSYLTNAHDIISSAKEVIIGILRAIF